MPYAYTVGLSAHINVDSCSVLLFSFGCLNCVNSFEFPLTQPSESCRPDRVDKAASSAHVKLR